MNRQRRKKQVSARTSLFLIELYGGILFLLLICLLLAFFTLLLGVYFMLFELLDYILTQPWQWGWRVVLLGSCLMVTSVLVVRLAWRMALAILGLVTRKYDESTLTETTHALSDTDSPGLYELVREVSHTIGALPPDEVRVSPAVECYVIEERRFAIRTRRHLTLVIGLPHLLVLELAELKVILVHEMAHSGGGDTTITVFLFRFVESLRIAVDELAARGRWWYACDPFYWFFVGFHRLVHRAAVSLQRHRELRADAISAETFGGTLATHTLLKEWLLENQFDQVVEQYMAKGPNDTHENVFAFFVDRWREFGRTSEAYLEQRLNQQEESSFLDSHPSMKTRIKLMRDFPDPAPTGSRAANQLLTNLDAIQHGLHDQLFDSLRSSC